MGALWLATVPLNHPVSSPDKSFGAALHGARSSGPFPPTNGGFLGSGSGGGPLRTRTGGLRARVVARVAVGAFRAQSSTSRCGEKALGRRSRPSSRRLNLRGRTNRHVANRAENVAPSSSGRDGPTARVSYSMVMASGARLEGRRDRRLVGDDIRLGDDPPSNGRSNSPIWAPEGRASVKEPARRRAASIEPRAKYRRGRPR